LAVLVIFSLVKYWKGIFRWTVAEKQYVADNASVVGGYGEFSGNYCRLAG